MRLCSSRVLALGLLFVLGCGGEASQPVHPVAGKVTLGGSALTSGDIVFVPDKEKGNTAPVSPSAQIGPDGSYQLTTGDRSGAPAGWYKVTVTTNGPSAPPNAPPVPARYNKFALTDLAVEVTAAPAPGGYDFKLKKQ